MTIMTDNGTGVADETVGRAEDTAGAAPRGHRPETPDQLAERRKKRRRKTKRKAPYVRSDKASRAGAKRRYNQPEAPYNSNRFLIEDHNDLRDIDVDLLTAANNRDNPHQAVQRSSPARARARDSSFTSVDSDEDFYYSSPEDEEEFLSKEFSNTYKDLHVETLAGLSKTELIQHVLSLEERMDTTQKKLEALSRNNPENASLGEKVLYFQEEISKLVVANRTLLRENEQLRRQRDRSTEDSESDSSSTTSRSTSTSSTDSEPSRSQTLVMHPLSTQPQQVLPSTSPST